MSEQNQPHGQPHHQHGHPQSFVPEPAPYHPAAGNGRPAAGQPQYATAGFPPADRGQPQQGQAPVQTGAGGQGRLVINLRKPMGIGSAAMLTPTIKIDGFPARCHWEQNVFDVPAGHRHVLCEVTYMWAYGQAQTTVPVAPGQTVELYYASPMVSFGAGNLGFEPQQRPGMLTFWLIMAVPLLVLLLIIISIVVSTVSG